MRAWMRFGLASLAYFVAARLGYVLAIPNGISVLWPASGVMVAALALTDRTRWPALVAGGIAGSLASDLIGGFTPGLALGAALANGTETLVAAAFLQWWCGPRVSLSTLRNVLGFVSGAVLVCNGVTAMLGALTLDRPFATAWMVWWIGDGLGTLIVAPVILGCANEWSALRRLSGRRLAEALALVVILAATVWTAFGKHHGTLADGAPYAVFPLLFWAGLRFGPAGAAWGAAIVAVGAVANAAAGQGPLVEISGTGEMLALHVHVYLFVASLSSLIPAAILEERQAARRAVAESEQRYRNLFESNPQPTWVYDTDTLRFLAVNDAAVSRYGYTRAEFLERTILDIRPVEDLPRLRQWIAARGPRASERNIWRHRLKDGKMIDVDVSAHDIDFAGRPARVVQAVDLTEQRKAEESLRATRERLEHVIASSGAVLFQLALEAPRRFTWVSSNATQVLGYRPEEILAPGWWGNVAHPDDVRRTTVPDNADGTGHDEYRLRHADGRYRWFREERRRQHGGPDDRSLVVGTWIDVTHWRELEAQFRQAQKLEAVGRLSGSVAHDFNNLLTVILGEVELLLATTSGQAASLRASLDAIHGAAERAALLTRQLLLFSRRQIVSPEPLNLSHLVTNVDRMTRRLIGEDVDIVLRLDPDLPPTMADRGHVEQVLVNLVVNARDAMPQGGVLTIETSVADIGAAGAAGPAATRTLAPGRYVTLAVSDTGTGMDEQVKQRLFEPFFTTKEAGKGTGLGLATCDTIARQLGGCIDVVSEPGAGSTLRVYLPTMPAESASVTQVSSAAPRGGSETILLVEDDRDVRRTATRALEELGYQVHQAADGEEAIRFLQSYRGVIHLLLTDVVLPRLGGRDLADRAVEERPDIRVLFMSGYSADLILRDRVAGREAQLLQKPFTRQRLAEYVRLALDVN